MRPPSGGVAQYDATVGRPASGLSPLAATCQKMAVPASLWKHMGAAISADGPSRRRVNQRCRLSDVGAAELKIS
jgi:hypothetical protein